MEELRDIKTKKRSITTAFFMILNGKVISDKL
jgi:hypothetical protein